MRNLHRHSIMKPGRVLHCAESRDSLPRVSSIQISKLILKLIPVKGPYSLSLDWTNWKFSDMNINILTLGINHDGMAFPVVFKMMDKIGNSSTEDCKDLITKFLGIACDGSIAHLMAYREFVGSDRLAFLNSMGIHYHIGIRENFHVIRHGSESKAHCLFADLVLGECKHLSGIYYVNGQPCYLSASKIKDKDGSRSFRSLFLIATQRNHLRCTSRDDRLRRCAKGSRAVASTLKPFTSESKNGMANLLAIIMLAYVWCYLVDIYIHENIKKIKVLHHGRRAKSLFKYGLEYISQCLLSHTNRYYIDIFKFLSYT